MIDRTSLRLSATLLLVFNLGDRSGKLNRLDPGFGGTRLVRCVISEQFAQVSLDGDARDD